MRTCPSVEGSASPLITHRIGTEVCMARQRTFFHKCHRCIYRGQPANWEPAESPVAMEHVPEAPLRADPKMVEMARAAAADRKPAGKGKPKAGKALDVSV